MQTTPPNPSCWTTLWLVWGRSPVIYDIESVSIASTFNKTNSWLKLKHLVWDHPRVEVKHCEAGHHSSKTFMLCHPSQFHCSLYTLHNRDVTQNNTANILFSVFVIIFPPWWDLMCSRDEIYGVADQLHLLLAEKVSWIGLAPCAVMSSLWFLWERPPPQLNLAQAPL